MPPPIDKVIVAVHGIGSQYRYATIQSVAHRVASYFGPPVGIPLGSFHQPGGVVRALPFEGQPTLGLAEVYWADIPRIANKERDTLEETKAWAKTVVQRLRALAQKPNSLAPSIDYEKTSAVVEGMIDTVGILENLTFLAEKAGLMKFDLRALLDDYLGDVQIVAEFADHRKTILDRFRSTMEDLKKAHPTASIHIVAHSEGTVVTLLALLEALSNPGVAGYNWVNSVQSLMTIGSPLDKHMVMWGGLWTGFENVSTKRPIPAAIRWWNYYDYGDPVGFELDTTRQWLIHHGWISAEAGKLEPDGGKVAAKTGQQVFNFPKGNEVGFTRYPFPGKAHNDYWEDKDVFDHFLAVGMKLPRTQPKGAKQDPPDEPKTIPRWQFVSWVLPYLLVALVLLAGVYLVYKNVGDVMKSPETIGQLARSVLGLTGLLAGVTIVSRVPRLVPWGGWYLLPVGVFGIGAALYWWLVGDRTAAPGENAADKLGAALGAEPGDPSRLVMTLVCLAVGLIAAVVSKLKPKWGMWPLMLTSGGVTLFVLVRLIAVQLSKNVVITDMEFWPVSTAAAQLGDNAAKTDPKLWPVVLSALVFLYLWWLAAQLFDLIFVWHRYIRCNLANNILKEFDPVLALRKREAKAAQHKAGGAKPDSGVGSA